MTLDERLARLTSGTGGRFTLDTTLITDLAGALAVDGDELTITVQCLLDLHAEPGAAFEIRSGSWHVDLAPAVARATVLGAIATTVLQHLGAGGLPAGILSAVATLLFSVERAEVTDSELLLHGRMAATAGTEPQDLATLYRGLPPDVRAELTVGELADLVGRLEKAGLTRRRGGEIVLRPAGGLRRIRLVCRTPGPLRTGTGTGTVTPGTPGTPGTGTPGTGTVAGPAAAVSPEDATGHTYDIAVSFAGAQRSRVEEVVEACEALGLRVFYDKKHTVELWGRNFVYAMRKVYGSTEARFFVPFLSTEYLAGAYPMDEFDAAIAQALKRRDDGYVLPILVGDVQVPAELLSPAVGRLRAENHTAAELANILRDRVADAKLRRQEPRGIPGVVEEALDIRLPRIPPVTFSEYATIRAALTRVGGLFERAADRLAPYGLTCRVHATDDVLDVRVEDRGRQICGLRVRFEQEAARDGRLVVGFAWPRVTGDASGSWATAGWDPDAGQAKLRYVDAGVDTLVDPEGLFRLLWQKIIDFVEQRR